MMCGNFFKSGALAALLCGAGLAAVPAFASVIDRPFFKAQALVVVIAATDDELAGGLAPYAVDFALLNSASGTAANDLIADDGFVMVSNSGWDAGPDLSAGASNLTLDDETSGGSFSNGGDSNFLEAADSFTAFGLDETTDINTRNHLRLSRFLVVSNSAFDIYAQASNLATTGDFTALNYENIGINIRTHTSGGSGAGAWGSAAQNPAVGGSGLDGNINDLGDISAGATKVFDGGRRTAASRGTLLEQAISFSARYALSPDPDSGNADTYDFSMGAGTIGADVTFTVYTP